MSEQENMITVGDVTLKTLPDWQGENQIHLELPEWSPKVRKELGERGTRTRSMTIVAGDITDAIFALIQYQNRLAPGCGNCAGMGVLNPMRLGLPHEYDEPYKRGSLWVCDACHARSGAIEITAQERDFYAQMCADREAHDKEVQDALVALLGEDKTRWEQVLKEKFGVEKDACPECENDTDNPADLDAPKPICKVCGGTGEEPFSWDEQTLERIQEAIDSRAALEAGYDEPRF